MRVALLALTLAACSRPVPAPLPPATLGDFGLADCPASTPMPVTANVCGNTVTASGLRCVRCQVAQSCVYRDAMVYCAPTCSDRACGAGL